MMSRNQYYLYVVLLVLIISCLNIVRAVNPSMYSYLSNTIYSGDTIKVAKVTSLQDKVKLIHKPAEKQLRIETSFSAAESLTAEIVNMLGTSCLKNNFRANTTIDYTLSPGVYFVVVYYNKQRIFSSKIAVSQ